MKRITYYVKDRITGRVLGVFCSDEERKVFIETFHVKNYVLEEVEHESGTFGGVNCSFLDS